MRRHYKVLDIIITYLDIIIKIPNKKNHPKTDIIYVILAIKINLMTPLKL